MIKLFCKKWFLGINIGDWDYYINWNHKSVRDWGYEEIYYDGPHYRFSLYFISFIKSVH